MKQQLFQKILKINSQLQEAGIAYQLSGETALAWQGIESDDTTISIVFQWDALDTLHRLFPGKLTRDERTATIEWEEVRFTCHFNTTVRTDPYRTELESIPFESLYRYSTDPRVIAQLAARQGAITAANEQAWNQGNYAAHVKRFGSAAEIAAKITVNPHWRIYPFGKYIDLAGKRVAHVMGSNGVKAVAMAQLGADVTVFDFSSENADYARDVAAAANVTIGYEVTDVLAIDGGYEGQFDYVVMELGVLHYMLTLAPLMEKVARLLKIGGRYVLHEFHPISTKLITSTGKKHKVTGNYFDPDIVASQVAFEKHSDAGELNQVLQRKWTLGEVVTAIAQAGLFIEVLEEEPNHKVHDIGLPKTYTIVARKL